MELLKKYAVLALVLSTFPACQSLPGGDKKAFLLTSTSEENKMGDEAYREILKKEKVSKDKRLTAMLNRVGKRIAAVAPVDDFKWEFVLIESKEMNAFCLPGGKVAFYTGILPVVENEAGMAIVMGHEVAHAVLRHGGQRMSQGMALQFGLAAIDATLLKNNQYKDQLIALMGAGASVGVMLPFSRGNESEADGEGINYAAEAGYDPAEGPRFWQRFSKAMGKGGKPPEFLSTHPSDSSRISHLKKLLPEAEQRYQKSAKYGLGEKI